MNEINEEIEDHEKDIKQLKTPSITQVLPNIYKRKRFRWFNLIQLLLPITVISLNVLIWTIIWRLVIYA